LIFYCSFIILGAYIPIIVNLYPHMFLSNFKILSSIDSQFFMESFHFLFIKTDTPLLALSYFFTPLKGVYNFPVIHFLLTSFLFLLKLPHPFSLYLFLLLFPPSYFCSLGHSMFRISKSCFLAWVVYLCLIFEAWCLVF